MFYPWVEDYSELVSALLLDREARIVTLLLQWIPRRKQNFFESTDQFGSSELSDGLAPEPDAMTNQVKAEFAAGFDGLRVSELQRNCDVDAMSDIEENSGHLNVHLISGVDPHVPEKLTV